MVLQHEIGEILMVRDNPFSKLVWDSIAPDFLMHYGGWAVYDWGEGHHPVTGRFRASRHGVTIGCGTESGIMEMIDHKRYGENE